MAVRVTPRGGRDAIDGIEVMADGRAVLKVRVRVAPEDGAANDAVTRLLAKALGLAPREVSLASGATSRLKQIAIAGDAAALAARLAALVAPAGKKP